MSSRGRGGSDTAVSPSTHPTAHVRLSSLKEQSRPVKLKGTVIVAAVVVASLGVAIGSATAEQTDPKRTIAPPQSQPKLIIRADELFPLTPSRMGMFTFVPPETDGEFIRVGIPVGELVSRAARAVSNANHRRAERKADERVRKDVAQFLALSKTKGANAP